MTQTYATEPAPRAPAHPLDNPARSALTGPHARFAEKSGRVLRYDPEVTPWLALPDDPTEQDWTDLAAFAGPDGAVPVLGTGLEVPDGWQTVHDIPGVQLVDVAVDAVPEPEAVRLTTADVPQMLDLVARTRPGPFLARTIELGTYLGIRREGRLVALAGERLHPTGWTEISAVCTDPDQRGQGLAGRLVRAVAAGIKERGETPFLHTGAGNTNAIRLYESLGFELRRTTRFREVRVPRLP
ncbi:GNAT family N-acetyltransferase [Streptomyces sp. NPDC050095]|uniref:GNAT family N-acetyltransferase n=1 Tax=unclassified Streptomyces TaxID=2593676 RepID=UPI003420BC21